MATSKCKPSPSKTGNKRFDRYEDKATPKMREWVDRFIKVRCTFQPIRAAKVSARDGRMEGLIVPLRGRCKNPFGNRCGFMPLTFAQLRGMVLKEEADRAAEAQEELEASIGMHI